MPLNVFWLKFVKRALEKVHLLGNNNPGTYSICARASALKSLSWAPGRGPWAGAVVTGVVFLGGGALGGRGRNPAFWDVAPARSIVFFSLVQKHLCE